MVLWYRRETRNGGETDESSEALRTIRLAQRRKIFPEAEGSDGNSLPASCPLRRVQVRPRTPSVPIHALIWVWFQIAFSHLYMSPG